MTDDKALPSEKQRTLDELIKSIDEAINNGQYNQSLALLKNAEKLYRHNDNVRLVRHAFYIDIGTGLADPSYIWKGIKDGTRLLKKDAYASYRGAIHYDLANGYSNLYSLEMNRNRLNVRDPDDKNLQQAKKHYRFAEDEINIIDSNTLPRFWTNYANCLDHLGRQIEALELYDKALALIPDFSMAIGNKAEALLFFAQISGKYMPGTYRTAHQMLKSVVDKPDLGRIGGFRARQTFLKDIERIESRFVEPSSLMKPVLHPPIDWTSINTFERGYVRFCLEHHLFLNLHIHADDCEAAIGDPIVIRIITAANDDSTFGRINSQINQIKEDYIVARFQLFLALNRSNILDDISQRTTFVRYPETHTFTLYTGLLKTAFKSAFGILDKVACFVNEFFGIGLSDTSIDFSNPQPSHCVWRDGDRMRDQLRNTNNLSLFAIYDIFLDFVSGHYQTVHAIRNALTHRQLAIVHDDRPFDKSGTIGFSNMVTETINLLQLIRAAIIYVINMVELEARNEERGLPEEYIQKAFVDTKQFFQESQ